MDVTENLLFGSALLSGAALWAFVRERRRSFIQSRVIAATNSGVLVTDASVPRHPIIQANPAFRLLTGYAESEVLGQSTHLLNGAHTDRTAIEKIGLALQDSRACRVTIRHYRKNGTPFWNEVTLSPVKNRAGTVVQFIWVMNDVTQLQQAEEALRVNERRFADLIESLPQLFWTCRADGPCDYLSRQWVEYTGVPEEQQLGYRWLEQLHPDDKDRTVSEWMEKVKTGESFDVEFRIRRHDDQYRWFKTRAVPMRDAKGNISQWFGCNTDFDEIKKAEARLESSSRELEEKVAERTTQLEAATKELEPIS